MWALNNAKSTAEIMWRDLELLLRTTDSEWRDEERAKFENQYWKPIEEAAYKHQYELSILCETLDQIARNIP